MTKPEAGAWLPNTATGRTDVSGDKQHRPNEPADGQYVWHRGWEIGFYDDAEFWTGNGWQAYKGGADIGAPNLSACTFEDLIEEIEAEETPL